jgi:hypothetical protein
MSRPSRAAVIIPICVFIAIIIFYLVYKSHVSELTERKEFLINTCNSITASTTNLFETDKLFDGYYSEDISTNSTTSKKLYGLSESKFDTFCVVTYRPDKTIIKSGVSYD